MAGPVKQNKLFPSLADFRWDLSSPQASLQASKLVKPKMVHESGIRTLIGGTRREGLDTPNKELMRV